MGRELAQGAIQNAFAALARSILEGLGEITAAMGASWAMLDTPDLITNTEPRTGAPQSNLPPAGEGRGDTLALVQILEWASWVALAVCLLALVATGALMAVNTRRGEGSDHLRRLGLVLTATVLVSGATGIATALVGRGPSIQGSGPVVEVQQNLWWYVAGALILSVIIGAAKMAWQQRAEPGKALIQSLITFAVVSGAGVTAVGLMVAAADSFAQWVIEDAADGDFGKRVMQFLHLSNQAGSTGLGVITLIVLGTLAMLVSLVQILLLIVRDGMLVILVAVLPLAAAFTNTEMGMSWFRKCCGWLLAFILYKPAAAIVYATAFELVATDGGEATVSSVVTGIALMLVALVALPALMRMVQPAAAIAGGTPGAGAMAGAASTVGGEIGQGAVRWASSGEGAGGGAAQGSAPAPGRSPGAADAGGADAGGGAGDGDDRTLPKTTAKDEPQGADTALGGGGGGPAAQGAGEGAAEGAAEAAAGPAGFAAAGAEEAKEDAWKGVHAMENMAHDAVEDPDGSR
ncbi:hypothetical protein ACFPZ0_04165 [Streptomonospora nanhaiensis]|uniref:Uncharacterized protein n=2 Tax=Streptomonospora nanhaiensis TaxID=1323731 RepID=A0A853BRK9_9ACTN|nr:hypothetical protein [Streptomonospora nanhaiensis]NYI97336.1 hypothetical protein [Streptomonospora nanhaiensis]